MGKKVKLGELAKEPKFGPLAEVTKQLEVQVATMAFEDQQILLEALYGGESPVDLTTAELLANRPALASAVANVSAGSSTDPSLAQRLTAAALTIANGEGPIAEVARFIRDLAHGNLFSPPSGDTPNSSRGRG